MMLDAISGYMPDLTDLPFDDPDFPDRYTLDALTGQ